MKKISITLFIIAILFNATAKAELELIPISGGEYIKEWVAESFGMEEPQLVNALTTPYIVITGYGNYDYTFKWEGDSIGYATFWIFTYRDLTDYDNIAAVTLFLANDNLQVMTWNISMLELFYGFKFSGIKDINITEEDFTEYVAKIRTQSPIYEKIISMDGDYVNNLFAIGVGFPDNIAFKGNDLTDLNKEQLIYYTSAFYPLSDEVSVDFCYADAAPVGELSCIADNNSISEFIVNSSLAPNPASDDCILTFDLTDATNVTINVIDVLGRNIMQLYDNYTDSGIFTHIFDTKELPNGIYNLVMRIGNNVKVEKLVVNR